MTGRPAAPRVLVLAVDPFGVGGIERFTRVFLHCLQELFGPDEVGLVSLGSLRSHDPGCRVLHAGTSQRLGFRKKVRYLAASLRAAHRWREGLPLPLNTLPDDADSHLVLIMGRARQWSRYCAALIRAVDPATCGCPLYDSSVHLQQICSGISP